MGKFFEKLRTPISYISLIVIIAICVIVAIGESVDFGTLYLPSFSLAIVLGVCLLLYIIGNARGKAFPILVAVIVVMFIFLLKPYLDAQVFEFIQTQFNRNAALGLAEILNLIMILGGIAVLVLYILEAIFGFKLSFIINIVLLVLVGIALLYFLLTLIGVIISLANNTGASWYNLLSPIIPVCGFLFVCVNFSFLEEKTKNL